jgi:hypothetical protein
MSGPGFIAKQCFSLLLAAASLKVKIFALLAYREFYRALTYSVSLQRQVFRHGNDIFFPGEIYVKPALALIMPLQEAICTFPCTRFAASFFVDYSPWPHCPVNSGPTGSNSY